MSVSSRRKFLLQSSCYAAATLPSCFLLANSQEKSNRPDLRKIHRAKYFSRATKRAIDKGLSFLASRQNQDGSFGNSKYRLNVGVSSLIAMAFLSEGSTPRRGKYGKLVQKVVDLVLSHAQPSGFISSQGTAGHGPMYGHGFATLFLAEVFGMAPSNQIRQKLALAVKLIINTQNHEGGWRYKPQKKDADISVTACQVMALRAAKNAGLFVPPQTIKQSVAYLKLLQNSDGGFRYIASKGPSKFPRSAAALVAFYSAGIYQGPEITKGLTYLLRHRPQVNLVIAESEYFYYGHYYAMQAVWHSSLQKHWDLWYPAVRDVMLANQDAQTGAWKSEKICPEYSTAMACLALQMPNNYLPIFER